MDLLTVCNEDFMMIKALKPPKTFSIYSYIDVKELYGLYVKELEERCK